MNLSKEFYMKSAIEQADINLANEFKEGGPFGAIIVNPLTRQIVGRGKNNVLVNNDPTAHAEISAIRDACDNLKTFDLRGLELYTSCYPCPMCLGAIVWSNISKVYYGNTKEDAADIGFRDDAIYDMIKGNKSDCEIIFEQIDRDETIKTFKVFKDMSDKMIY